MELTNEFRVALPADRAWEILTDLERIAPCMPGAQLQEVEGDVHRGIVKVKVGPVQAQYKGEATFLERDEGAHVAVLRAEGRESRGQGNASATITARLTPDGDGTTVTIETDLTITGRVAQFGRGVLQDVSSGLLDQFVGCLGDTVLASDGADEPAATTPTAADGPAEPAADPGVRRIQSPEAAPVDLVGAAGSPVAKRIAPLLALVVIIYLARRLLSGRSGSGD